MFTHFKRGIVWALVFLCGAIIMTSRVSAAPKHNGVWVDSLTVDTLKTVKGDTFIRVRYTDIIIHLTSGGWYPQDSSLFFSERMKTELATKILLDQINKEKDSLSQFIDSAGIRIGNKSITKQYADSVIKALNTAIEQKIQIHDHALRRLEDYRRVLHAANKILMRKGQDE